MKFQPVLAATIFLMAFSGICLSQEILIINANVVDVRTGSILSDQSVSISDGRIASIQESGTENPKDNARVIDARGGYIIPGLAEMHAHIPSSDWGRKNPEETLFLYLSNGVTTIRGMLGHPEHLELRQRAAANELLSPRIFTSSPSLNGNTIRSEEEAETKVREYAAQGYDFLKIHPGIKRENFDVVVKTAMEVGIPFAGHVPVDVGIVHALESGYASVDHVDGYLEGLVPSDAGVQADQNGFFGYNFTSLADEKRIPDLVRLTKENEVWVVPTQTLFERWFSPEPASKFLSDKEMAYMPASILANWEASKEQLMKDPSFNTSQWTQFNELRRKLIYSLHHNGHGLLLGSDAPQVFNVPGFSLHNEMSTMLKAGLTPLEIIQSGTINPARYFKMEGEFGEVVQGSSADLMILESNPLENISNLRNPAYVIVRGIVLTRDEINTRLRSISESAKNE